MAIVLRRFPLHDSDITEYEAANAYGSTGAHHLIQREIPSRISFKLRKFWTKQINTWEMCMWFHSTLNRPGIRIVHVQIKRDPPLSGVCPIRHWYIHLPHLPLCTGNQNPQQNTQRGFIGHLFLPETDGEGIEPTCFMAAHKRGQSVECPTRDPCPLVWSLPFPDVHLLSTTPLDPVNGSLSLSLSCFFLAFFSPEEFTFPFILSPYLFVKKERPPSNRKKASHRTHPHHKSTCCCQWILHTRTLQAHSDAGTWLFPKPSGV